MGKASFNSSNNAAKARSKMASVAAYSQVIFDITPAKSSTSSNGVDVSTPPATLSSSSKSTGSSGSMQHSRLSRYVKDKPDLTPINAVPSLTSSTSLGMGEFYGSVPRGSLGLISSSVPINLSTSAGGTIWSPHRHASRPSKSSWRCKEELCVFMQMRIG
ncbi:hypothetical protein BCR37DRAFT_257050 [Protomyces lactucae-debilis]|uniref:Uncharacterized protein n=1 Tax=Protomyces lactucae-debilis TaxID=2754530 RepID=A0A1Y2FM22_PROLT|nr:uncharacterized protein BCR37DRAFT_257034 [Protomyces lactucae-debilis]XP_040726806.1 uncharacterized protein BCR37DRAFT_257050 [Protomyces lactucae-debilis]ORY85021.1 hypothetical protein BCR37DRAFT_257034 [Protomyces lactucae-debilis]ORY85023.1 hypothetical protein BCR37DRAFT_257050 [Protomyces lactucae-debilis]